MVFIVVIIVSVFLTYKRAFIDQNFEIINIEENSQ